MRATTLKVQGRFGVEGARCHQPSASYPSSLGGGGRRGRGVLTAVWVDSRIRWIEFRMDWIGSCWRGIGVSST